MSLELVDQLPLKDFNEIEKPSKGERLEATPQPNDNRQVPLNPDDQSRIVQIRSGSRRSRNWSSLPSSRLT